MKIKSFRHAVLFALAGGLAVAGLLAVPPPGVQAQDASMLTRLLTSGKPAARNITAISTDVPIYVKYIGSNTSGGTIAVSAAGDITLSTGAVGGSAVDTTLECPVSAPLGGIIDVSDAACNTLGEVVDIINASPNWIAYIKDGWRSGNADDVLATLSEAAANARNGLGLVRDGATAFDTIADLSPEATNLADVTIAQGGQGEFTLKPNPYAGRQVLFLQGAATSTYASGTSTLRIYDRCQLPKKAAGAAIAVGVTSDQRETLTQLWQQAGGATTVSASFTVPSYGIVSSPGCSLLVMTDNSAAMSASVLTAYGVSYRFQP